MEVTGNGKIEDGGRRKGALELPIKQKAFMLHSCSSERG
jgi:hypothetical protein